MNKVRVRIAPSPTGFVHIGNLRTILYNYLFARHNNGDFLVRIEDTDRTRYVPGALEDLLKTLEWAGFNYDEGPKIVGDKIVQTGDFGPYVQSERLDIYREQIKTLLDKGKAYYCFCSKDRLDTLREEQAANKQPPKYDRCCRDLDASEVQSRLAKNESHVIRFKMPDDKDVVFEDAIRGLIKVNTNDLDDYVLLKADNYPTYHFANVIDDHTMKITHVLRADEWIPSTPKHILMYEAFGWTPPIFAHLPQILNKNKKKMSKRDGDVSVKDFIKAGYLQPALINFIALLGWNAGTEQEIYTPNEMIKQFSLDNVHKAGAIFDKDKLDWINGTYIRKFSADELLTNCLPYLKEAGLIIEKRDKLYNFITETEVSTSWLKKVCQLEQERIKTLGEVGEKIKFMFVERLEYAPELLIWKKSDAEKTKKAFVDLIESLSNIDEAGFVKDEIEKNVMAMIEQNSYSNGDVFWPMRVALSGCDKSPGPVEIADALCKQQTLTRLKDALIKL